MIAGRLRRVAAYSWSIGARLSWPALAIAVAAVTLFCTGAYLHVAASDTYQWPDWPIIVDRNPQYSGSQACIAYARKIEGTIFSGVHTLHCTLTPESIGNSTLSAWHLEYYGAPKDDPERCNDIDKGFWGDAADRYRYCLDYSGIVLSDGQIIAGFAYDEPTVYAGSQYCFMDSSDASVNDALKQPGQGPTKTDLYFYNGHLYQRYVFDNVHVRTKFGTCIVNGTTLTRDATICDGMSCVGEDDVTNATVSYEGFPTSCAAQIIGATAFDVESCINLVTAANASPTECDAYPHLYETGRGSDGRPENDVSLQTIGTAKTDNPFTITNECWQTYIDRMAELGRCNELSDPDQRTACVAETATHALGITRATDL